MSIKKWYENRKNIVVPLVIITTVAMVSFGLGYIYGTDLNPTPIVIEKCGL